MERLEQKKINGKSYYYYSKWAWVNGKCRRVWQKYLGKLEDIANAVGGIGTLPRYAEIFQWGLPNALWSECCRAEIIEKIDKLCPKRDQGLSIGEYISIAAINRAIHPESKRSMWSWFSQTTLLRHIPNASKAALMSQRFWDHMDKISTDMVPTIWKNILIDVIIREKIDLSSISYDGTNFYTFIDTFNSKCEIGKRGKNKQGRNNLRQISYALFCCADGFMPLYYDVYEGNRNDAKQFPIMVRKFHKFLEELSGRLSEPPDTTIIFDKGNNSKNNFDLINSLNKPLKIYFVGSVKLGEHKELAEISNNDKIFQTCSDEDLEGAKCFRIKKEFHGKEIVFIVTYNQNLFNTQFLTLQNDIIKATGKLESLKQKLEDRINGITKGGRTPTVDSIERQSKNYLKRQYVKNIIKTEVKKGPDGIPRLSYSMDSQNYSKILDTYIGKNIIITNREEWEDEKIIKAYRSQYIIEDIFKQMKDRQIGNWWPQYHWTDSKIIIHGLYCTISLLLRALIFMRLRNNGLKISAKRIIAELDGIKEVVNIYPKRRRQGVEPKTTVLTKLSEIQEKAISILDLKKCKNDVLG